MPGFDIPTGTKVRCWWSPNFDLTVIGPGDEPALVNTVDPEGFRILNLRVTDLLPASYPASDYELWSLARRLVDRVAKEQGGITGHCPDALSFAVLCEVQGNDPREIAFAHWAWL